MKSAKCPNCGANITVDESKDAGICEFCQTPFITEKAISFVNNTSNNAQTIINNYYTAPTPANTNEKTTIHHIVPPRPRVKLWLAIILCYFYIFPGIIYINSVKKQQKDWDIRYGSIK